MVGIHVLIQKFSPVGLSHAIMLCFTDAVMEAEFLNGLKVNFSKL